MSWFEKLSEEKLFVVYKTCSRLLSEEISFREAYFLMSKIHCIYPFNETLRFMAWRIESETGKINGMNTLEEIKEKFKKRPKERIDYPF